MVTWSVSPVPSGALALPNNPPRVTVHVSTPVPPAPNGVAWESEEPQLGLDTPGASPGSSVLSLHFVSLRQGTRLPRGHTQLGVLSGPTSRWWPRRQGSRPLAARCELWGPEPESPPWPEDEATAFHGDSGPLGVPHHTISSLKGSFCSGHRNRSFSFLFYFSL